MPLGYSTPIFANEPHDALRILIVDDHMLVADMLELLLGRLGRTVRVFKATSMPQALAQARAAGGLDLAVLDLHMPDMDGLAGLRHLRVEYPDLPIAIMSGDATAEAVKDATENGANGFIPKTIGGPAILDALRQILAGEPYHPAELPGTSSPQVEDPAAAIGLSPREREVLGLLTEGLSNKEIARRLGIEIVTTALHLTHIYRKLGVSGRTQAVRRALELHLDRLPAPSHHS